MRMNYLEKLAMNNPVRAWIQRNYEGPLLLKMGGDLAGLDVLEIGCGRGVGTEFLLDKMGARKVIAIDLDEGMVERARRRLDSRYAGQQLQIRVGDATALDLPDESQDAVVNFAAIHHVPIWQDAVAEVRRVLKPGGRFFFQEVTRKWISRWPYRVIFEHPMENRFSGREFVEELHRIGIEVGDDWIETRNGDFIFGVGRRCK